MISVGLCSCMTDLGASLFCGKDSRNVRAARLRSGDLMLTYEISWQEAEGKIRKQSNAEIAYIATNPFKLVVNHKSAHKDEWAQMNSNQAQKGASPSLFYLEPQVFVNCRAASA